MAKYLSNRQRNLKIGITSYTENSSVLEVIGNVNIAGIITASQFSGDGTGLSGVSADTATYASTAGIATYATSAGIATYASTAGIVTYATSSGIATYASTAGIATSLQNARTFEITGDIIASPISFDGTDNVSLAATIQPNSVGLGTDTFGDYVQSISGTSNQITVTSGTGEGSTPTLSIPNQFTVPQDIEVARDLQVNRNLNVNGNITIGGTSATLFTTEFKVYDPDIVLGFRTDAFGNDVSTDNTANHGGIAIASTEGDPLVQLFIAGIETNPATYKKIMWFKAGEFSGLGTDAWLSNYAIGIGSTQFPSGTRLAAGSIQFTENDLAVVRNINSSGIVTAAQFFGDGSNLTGVSAFNVINQELASEAVYPTLANSTGVSSVGISTTQLVFIPSFGNLGIGTTNPTSKLSVTGDVSISGVTTTATLNVGVGGTIITTTGIGSVGIGSTQPTALLDINAPSGYSGNSLSLPLIGFSTIGQINIGRYASDNTGVNGYFFNGGPVANQRHGMSTRYSSASNGIAFWGLGNAVAGIMNRGFFVDGTYGLGWSSGSVISTNPETFIFRDSAGVLAQRNAGIGQTFRIYNTYTSATNFERVNLGWTNNVFIVGTEKGSSIGTARQLEIQTDGTTRVAITTTGNVGIGSTQPTSKLTVVGDVNITGIVTATKFVGEVEIINPFLLMGA